MTALASPPVRPFLRDVLAGLSASPRRLPCKWLYDERGSALFDEICTLDEYYPTRCEQSILQAHAREMARLIGPCAAVIEYGSGSSFKTRLLLDALARPCAYVPVDISREHLLRSAARLQADYHNLTVAPIVADFTRPFSLPALPSASARRTVFFSGSTISNFGPPEDQALLAGIARVAGKGGALLIGVDLRKDRAILEAAYDDARGVTASFNLNLLRRINRELGGTFDLSRWRHLARWDDAHSRIEMHLVSKRAQSAEVGGQVFRFAEGERLCTEHSYKFTLPGFASLAERAGLRVRRAWIDEAGLFSVQYAEVA